VTEEEREQSCHTRSDCSLESKRVNTRQNGIGHEKERKAAANENRQTVFLTMTNVPLGAKILASDTPTTRQPMLHDRFGKLPRHLNTPICIMLIFYKYTSRYLLYSVLIYLCLATYL